MAMDNNEIEKNQKVSIEMLKKVLAHPSEKKGGVFATADDKDNEDDDVAEDYESDDEGCNKSTKKQHQQYCQSYMPSPSSYVGLHLESIKNKIMKMTLAEKCTGKHWYGPKHDAVAIGIGNTPVPRQFYEGSIWVYCWDPEAQFPDMVDCILCIYCNEGTKSNGWFWRPMFWWNRIVWVLHKRHLCTNKCCKHMFATIDHRSLSKLPTEVADWFEFVTMAGGPGIHESMLAHTLVLCCSSAILHLVGIIVLPSPHTTVLVTPVERVYKGHWGSLI